MNQLSTTKLCLSTTKSLYDLRGKYKDAPLIIVSICSETSVISASLAQIQSLLLQRQHTADPVRPQPELPALLLDVLDQALIGCKVVLSCLDLEMRPILEGEPGSSPPAAGWRARARLVWNENKLSELLGALRGQQTAIGLVIQLFQVYELRIGNFGVGMLTLARKEYA